MLLFSLCLLFCWKHLKAWHRKTPAIERCQCLVHSDLKQEKRGKKHHQKTREKEKKREKNQYKMKMLRDTLKHLRNTEDVAESHLELHATPRE